MSASLIRLENGDLGVLYLRKSMKDKKLLCMPYFVRSSDEGKTFSAPILCVNRDGYYCVNNDRLIRLKNGRILFPAAYHGESGRRLAPGMLTVCYSDDDGRTFHQIEGFVLLIMTIRSCKSRDFTSFPTADFGCFAELPTDISINAFPMTAV